MQHAQHLHKYLPHSPHSQHADQQDSFEAEEMSREMPQPTSLSAQHNYELTFKKDLQQRYFAPPPESQPTRALFHQAQTDISACISQPLGDYYGKSMEELASLPFADLMSVQLEPFLREKVSLIGLILQLKRMRIKMRSASINIQCLKVKETLNHQDKHRLFLLQLLWKQLSKKIFLEALRLNLAHHRYEQQFAEAEHSRASHQVEKIEQSEHQSEGNSYGLWERQEESSQEEEVSENIKEKLMILVHGISHALRKALFSSFNKIAHAGNTGNPHTSECESIPLASRPNIQQSEEEEEEEQEEYYHNYQNATPQITYSKLEELESLIENLHEYCAENSDDLLKKYFVKWKISLLEAIAQSELNKLRNNITPEEEEEEEEEEERIEVQRQSRVSRESGVSRESRLTSQMSQGERTLKHEKKTLKEVIKSNAIRSFYCKLRNYNELRKIELICLQIRRQNTLRRYFLALKLNVQEEHLARQMAAYYEETAENQLEDDGTSKLFNKTNLLYCYFKRFKEHRRDHKIARTLQRIIRKLSFKKLLSFGSQEKKSVQVVARKLQQRRKHMLFKCFQAWKHYFLSENCYNERFRQHVKSKERETVQHCFSILKIQFKRALLRQRKAEQFYCNRLRANAFQAMQLVYEESKELSEKTDYLQSYLLFSKGRHFISQFKQFYFDYIDYQRFSIKEEKLRRTLVRLHALQSVKEWRKNMLKRQAYSAIEMKLVRYKIKQRKREIFSAWRDKAAKAAYSSSKSQKHKEWLVKYYGDLCAVLPS